MPVNKKMMDSMKKQYGAKKGESVYYAMENKKGMAEGGLWDNIHAKRKRIAAGSGETMRKKGAKGAPTAKAFKKAQGLNKGGYVNCGASVPGTQKKGLK